MLPQKGDLSVVEMVPRRWRVAGTLVGLALLALPVSSAVASSSASSVPTGIQIGPLTVGNGYKLTITGSCNYQHAYADVSLVKTGSGYTITHAYSDLKATSSSCKTSSKFGSGSMTLKWGGALSGKLKFSKAGSLKPLHFKYCKGTDGHYRNVTGTGTLKMAIHTGTFGRLDLHKVKAQIQEYNGTCEGEGGNTPRTELFASEDKGNAEVDAYETARGKRYVSVSAPDNVSRKVRGYADDLFEGKSVFSFKSNLSSAKLTGSDPFLTGSLKYKASGGCTDGTTTGKLSGKLVLHDPVSGTFRFVGKKAYGPSVSLSNINGNC